MNTAAKSAQDVLERLVPQMTLKEAGALLGISDVAAMEVEKAAATKLVELFRRVRVSGHRAFTRINDEVLDAIVPSAQAEDDYYTAARNWFALPIAKSINAGTEAVRDAILTACLMRMIRGCRIEVPVLRRKANQVGLIYVGVADSFTMRGPQGMFRSSALTGALRRCEATSVSACALVESERGQDLHGSFELPFLRAIVIAIDDSTTATTSDLPGIKSSGIKVPRPLTSSDRRK